MFQNRYEEDSLYDTVLERSRTPSDFFFLSRNQHLGPPAIGLYLEMGWARHNLPAAFLLVTHIPTSIGLTEKN